MLLESSGHDVRVAHLGQTALSVAQTFCPDVALLDIGMPDLSGYEVARTLRKQPWATDLQLIALTGWGQDDDRRRALLAGFDHHLTKPIDPDQLESLIAVGPPKRLEARREPELVSQTIWSIVARHLKCVCDRPARKLTVTTGGS